MTTEWPIDGIPDDALPRLLPRPLVFTKTGAKIYDPQDKGMSPDTGFFVLVALTDCAPFLGTWPPDLDELVAAATRLLLVPGGPLVLDDGRTTRLRRHRSGEAAFGHDRLWVSTGSRGLICFLSNLVPLPDLLHQPLGRYQRADLVRRVRRELGKFYWWRTASAFEMLDKYRMELELPMADPMLAGVPAKEDDHEEEMAH